MTSQPRNAAEAWDRLERLVDRPVFMRMGGEGVPELYYEITASGQWAIHALAVRYPDSVPVRSRACTIECAEAGSLVCVRVVLAEPDFAPVFLRLADAVADRAKRQGAGSRPEALLLGEFMRWRHMLAPTSNGVLTNAQQLGLMGELSYLIHLLSRGMHSVECVQAWKGPLGSDQDFHLPSGMVEVKAIEHGRATVGISSLEQLDAYGSSLCLVAYSIQSDVSGAAGVTLNSLVDRVEELLEEDPQARFEFSSKLERVGYQRGAEYTSTRRVVRDVFAFNVDSSFPALRRSQLPAVVERASYELSLASLPNRLPTLP